MGNTGIAYQSLYSISNNPAGIVGLQQCQIGAAYQSHFLTTEIQSQAAYAALPLASSHAIGFGVNSYGLGQRLLQRSVSTIIASMYAITTMSKQHHWIWAFNTMPATNLPLGC
jgi:hypothetical protein